MLTVLENEYLAVSVSDFGAEVRSVRDKLTGREYMWSGDPAYWGRVSPVLFPIVGGVGGSYRYRGTEYKMGQHGFARDNEFTLAEQTLSSLCYRFSENERTLAVYPFRFTLTIRYRLSGRTLSVEWEVENPSGDRLYFSIGAHPAFSCGNKEDGPTGISLVFHDMTDPSGKLFYRGLNSAGKALNESLELPTRDGSVTAGEGFFDRSALIFENREARAVTLIDADGTKLVTVSTNVPLFAVWSPEGKKAPFICIEPWYGRCDAEDFTGDFTEREYTERLEGGETFTGGYSILFHE